MQLSMRLCFAIGFVVFLIYNGQVQRAVRTDELAYEACMWDWFFDLLYDHNRWFAANLRQRDWIQIANSGIQDLSYAMLLYNFINNKSMSSRPIWSLAFMGSMKIQFQNNLQELGRIAGHLYGDPGVYSFTTLYHDINDYYYSGHMCWALISLSEFMISKDKWGTSLMIF